MRVGLLYAIYTVSCFFFFFQAEDGIRDYKVTGVQTCALPIYRGGPQEWPDRSDRQPAKELYQLREGQGTDWARYHRRGQLRRSSPWKEFSVRSEERRVGKESRSRWSPYH